MRVYLQRDDKRIECSKWRERVEDTVAMTIMNDLLDVDSTTDN